MEENDVLGSPSSTAMKQSGMALVVVLLAIVVLLPPTLVLATLAFRWQRQALDYRDTISEELVAEAGLAEGRNRIAADGLGLAPNEDTSFRVEVDEIGASVRIARQNDLVLTQNGRILEGAAARRVDLDRTAVDAEGRLVYQYRKLEVFFVQIDVSRRPTLPEVRRYAVVAKLPDGTVQVLGTAAHRGYFD